MDKLTNMLQELEATAWGHGYDEHRKTLTDSEIQLHDIRERELRELILCEVQKMLDDQPVFEIVEVVETRVFLVDPVGVTMIQY